MNQPLTKHLDGTLCISLFPITRDTWRTKMRDKEIWEALRAGYQQEKSTEKTNNARTKDKQTNRLPMQAFCSPKKIQISSSTFTVEREELGMREITQGQRNTLVRNSPTTFTLHHHCHWVHLQGQTGTRRGYYGCHAAANENEQKL